MEIEIYINLNVGMDIVCRYWEELIEEKNRRINDLFDNKLVIRITAQK